MASFQEFRSDVKPNWCPGCGDYAVLTAIQRAVAAAGIAPHQLALVSGIGCSGRLSGYVRSYGFHALHGRALPVAQGIKIANRDLTVIASGGDGDGFAIGTAHTVHAMRRNIDMTYIVMDNQIYGLTKGQTSPRSAIGTLTKSTPTGSIEAMISPIQLALASGATFIAQGSAADLKGITALIEKGIAHKGFAFINILSPCVTYNKVNTFAWIKENLVPTTDINGYDPSNKVMAMETAMKQDGLVSGLLYQEERPCYQSQMHGYGEKPLVEDDLQVDKNLFEGMMQGFV